jgi:ABC-type multidrug transport system ATPase subunit
MIEVLDLADKADRRARGLTADEKQKISLGRGWCATTSTRSCSMSR